MVISKIKRITAVATSAASDSQRALCKVWKSPVAGKILAPLSFSYAKAVEVRNKVVVPYKADVPVICVGNLTLGGVVKTPLAILIARHYIALGKKPCFLTRGYKGRVQNIFIHKNCDDYTAMDVGDEALLLLQVADLVVDKDRARGAETAVKNGAEVVIMDDGFQNPHLLKNKNILVFDGIVGIGNGKVFPAGYLREDFVKGLMRADIALIVREDKAGLVEKIMKKRPDLRVFKADIEPEKEVCAKIKGQKIFAFTGIGKPEKFFDTLGKVGGDVVKKRMFMDHYRYTQKDEENLIAENNTNLLFVTTQKDAVKLSKDFLDKVLVLPINLQIQKQADFFRALEVE